MQALLEMVDICKKFNNTYALKSVNFDVSHNETVGLVGENGAGKSTLMKILTGVHWADSGDIRLNGKNVSVNCLLDASKYGIGMIFQEQSILRNIKVYENLFITHEEYFKKAGFLSTRAMIAEAQKLLDSLGLDIHADAESCDLSFSKCQMLEIARNVWLADKSAIDNPLIVLDEPTTVLDKGEISLLFKQIEKLKKRASVIYISHNLGEIVELCDRVFVLKDGENAGCFSGGEITEDGIRERMVGQGAFSGGDYYLPDLQVKPRNDVVLEVEHVSKRGEFEDVSLKVKKGEILAICGTVGSGKEALCECIYGVRPFDAGTMKVNGVEVSVRTPCEAFHESIGYTPEDRRGEGLVLDLSIQDNMTLPFLQQLKKLGLFIDKKEQGAQCDGMTKSMNIKLSSLASPCSSLSGGNQQKVILAKWVMSKVSLLIMSHPTRGIDIKAKQQVYRIMREIASQGISIVMMGDSFEEDIGMANRIVIMKNRKVVTELDATERKPSPAELLGYII